LLVIAGLLHKRKLLAIVGLAKGRGGGSVGFQEHEGQDRQYIRQHQNKLIGYL